MMQGNSGLRANRLSCEKTARIEFFIFNLDLVQQKSGSSLSVFKPHSSYWGDALLSLGDVSAAAPCRVRMQDHGKIAVNFQ
jgi:hypothetical protein